MLLGPPCAPEACPAGAGGMPEGPRRGPDPTPGGPYTPPLVPSRPRHPWLLLLGSAVLVLLLAEGVARVLAPYLPEPAVYGDEATAVKIAQMDARRDRCTAVVVVGDSMARDAFDPATFTAADPDHRPAYNAALDAASPRLLSHWVPDEVVPRLHPSTVVIALASLDLNANGTAARGALASYEAAPRTRDDLVGRLDGWAMDASALAAHRRELRDPAAVADAVGRLRAADPAPRLGADGLPGVLGADGEGLSRRGLQYRGDAGAKAFTRSQLLGDWSLDGGQVAAAADLARTLHADGVQVAFVVLPVTDDYVALHPQGRADFDRFLDAVRGAGADTGTPVIDLHDARPGTASFADTHHPNQAGTAWFSSALPAELAGRGLPVDPGCG